MERESLECCPFETQGNAPNIKLPRSTGDIQAVAKCIEG